MIDEAVNGEENANVIVSGKETDRLYEDENDGEGSDVIVLQESKVIAKEIESPGANNVATFHTGNHKCLFNISMASYVSFLYCIT